MGGGKEIPANRAHLHAIRVPRGNRALSVLHAARMAQNLNEGSEIRTRRRAVVEPVHAPIPFAIAVAA